MYVNLICRCGSCNRHIGLSQCLVDVLLAHPMQLCQVHFNLCKLRQPEGSFDFTEETWKLGSGQITQESECHAIRRTSIPSTHIISKWDLVVQAFIPSSEEQRQVDPCPPLPPGSHRTPGPSSPEELHQCGSVEQWVVH